MSDLLLEIDIVVDLLADRPVFAQHAADALERCQRCGDRIWLYAGSLQTLEHLLTDELSRKLAEPAKVARQRARLLLQEFAKDKHWLAALAGEGDVFESDDSEDEQLMRAVSRFPEGSIAILTRDQGLRDKCAQASTPLEFLARDKKQQPVEFINLRRQQDLIRPAVELNTHKVLQHGQYIMGPEIKAVEEKLAAYTGVKHCITASSGTDTLLIALMALGIGPGDEVITSPFTFIATGEMIALTGARPVFVDIDPLTCNIDASLIEAAITPRTRAIMPVSLYGQCADFDAINLIAHKYSLPVIEDGAQSFGATYKERRSCSLSTIGSTSFFPSKPLGCYGDGGALFTNDDDLAKAMREIRSHGQERRYYHPRIGINGRLDTVQAAILLAKLELFNEEVVSRARIAARYTEALQDSVATPFIAAGNSSVYAQYTVQVKNRSEVQKRLQEENFPTAVHYPVPLHLQPVFAGLQLPEGSFPVAESAAKRVLSLPMHPYLAPTEQDAIVAALQRAVTC